MSARIEVFPGRYKNNWAWPKGMDDDLTGDWYWRLVGGNGETVCVSEAYTRKASAKRGAKRAVALMAGIDDGMWSNSHRLIVEVDR